jgi:phosphatidylserine/phosphatidylglycerophosphate/cardiolipin synthase-like enzyme
MFFWKNRGFATDAGSRRTVLVKGARTRANRDRALRRLAVLLQESPRASEAALTPPVPQPPLGLDTIGEVIELFLADCTARIHAGQMKAATSPRSNCTCPDQRKRPPGLYYDPRSLEIDYDRRASLHAKFIVIDKEQAFVSSANFTEAAQTKNIEVGVLLRSPPFACRLAGHFQALAEHGTLRPVPL